MDVKGLKALPNSGTGVTLQDAPGNLVGGLLPTPGGLVPPGNLISGNARHGIAVVGKKANKNTIQGNFIGPDVTGRTRLTLPAGGGQQIGVFVDSGTETQIGDAHLATGRNVVSGNDDSGIVIAYPDATGNRVEGNYIGPDPSGRFEIANDAAGVFIADSAQNFIGGPAPVKGVSPGNVISGNWASGRAGGVHLQGDNATGNKIQGNLIGMQAGGKRALGNKKDGVFITRNASDNLIGGATRDEGNVIAFNGRSGVAIDTGTNKGESTGNGILSNLIHDNKSIGIDLGLDYVTPNSLNRSGATKVGPNNWQNYPVIYQPGIAPAVGVVVLHSAPSTTFTVQLFDNKDGDISGFGQGEKLLDTYSMTTDSTGFVYQDVPWPAWNSLLSATVTDPKNNTSEFSKLPCQDGNTDPKMSVEASWIVPKGATHSGSLPGYPPILPVKYTPHGALTLHVKITKTDVSGGDDLSQVFVSVVGQSLPRAIPSGKKKPPVTGWGSIYAEQQPLRQQGPLWGKTQEIDLPIDMDNVLKSLAAGVNQDLVRASVKVCYAGKLQAQPTVSDNVLHIMRAKVVVFLPGVLGSKITLDDGSSRGIEAYPKLSIPVIRSIFGHDADKLEMNPNGTPKLKALKLELFDQYGLNWSTGTFPPKRIYDIQTPLRAAIRKYLPPMEIDGKPMPYYYAQPWPYDWRLDLNQHVDSLLNGSPGASVAFSTNPTYPSPPSVAQITAAAKSSDPLLADYLEDKVALAGHSTGGVIIRGALSGPGGQNFLPYVDHAFFINTPMWGAPKAYYAMMTGDMLKVFLAPDLLVKLAPNMPIVYALAPVPGYKDSFSNPPDQVIRFGTSTVVRPAWPPPVDTKYMLNATKVALSTAVWNMTLADAADRFQSAIYRKPPIIGWSNTIVFTSSSTQFITPGPTDVIGAGLVTFHPTLGDGTVPIESQQGDAPDYVTAEFQARIGPDIELIHDQAANNQPVWDNIVEELSTPHEKVFKGYSPRSPVLPNGGVCPDPEAFGEAEMDGLAQTLGYEEVLSPSGPTTIAQGFDGVYCDGHVIPELVGTGHACDGTVVIGEAKGGYLGKSLEDILGLGYFYRQGTIEWARRAAERTISSKKTNKPEKDAARMYLQALAVGSPTRIEVFHAECVSKPVPGTIPRPTFTKHYDTDRYP